MQKAVVSTPLYNEFFPLQRQISLGSFFPVFFVFFFYITRSGKIPSVINNKNDENRLHKITLRFPR